MAETILTTFHIFVCFALIGIVLLQQGKGADVGAAFGGGGNTFFGASGADNLLTRVTTIIAGMFMVTSVLLALNMRNGQVDNSALMQSLPSSVEVAPAPKAATDVAKENTPAPTATDGPAATTPESAPAATPEVK